MFQLGVVKSYSCQGNRLDLALRHADLPAEGFEPPCDGWLAAFRRRRKVLGKREPRRRIDEGDLAVWHRLPEGLHTRAGHAAVAQIEQFQFLQRLQPGKAGVRNPAAVEIQI